MAKKAKETSKKERRRGPKRSERRFVAHSAANVWIVRVIGAVAALVLGAGLYAYLYGKSFADDETWKAIPSYLIAAGAVLAGATIWLGTGTDSPLRVGDPGLAQEKGELRRMPWWGVSEIRFESGTLSVVVTGNDEAGKAWTFKVPIKSHPEAAAWIVREAEDRIPKRVDIRDADLERIPSASEHAGTKVNLEPLQVVGKKCAVTGKTITYEPDARVCERCERAYLKRSVPKKCKCGASLTHLRSQVVEDVEEEEEEDEELEQAEADGEVDDDAEEQRAEAEEPDEEREEAAAEATAEKPKSKDAEPKDATES
jgi:hypothetical protein